MALTDPGNNPEPKAKSGLSALIPYTTVAVLIAALYVAWTFYSRAQSAKESQQAIQDKREEARKRVNQQIFGSGEIKVTTFLADPGHLTKGQSAQLCYGVVNATTLKLDPAPNEPVTPTARHCIEISPKKTTLYTLTATDDKGKSESKTLTVIVQ